MRARSFLLRLLILAGLCMADVAMAHPILQNPLFVQVTPQQLNVRLYVSLRELSVVQGVPMALDGAMDPSEIAEGAKRHIPYLIDHLNLAADGEALSGRVVTFDPPVEIGLGPESPDRAHYIYYLEYPLTRPPGRITLRQSMVVEFPSSPGVPWDLSYSYRIGPPGATEDQWVRLVPGGQFGVLPREAEVSYATGFAPPAGMEAAAPDTPVSAWEAGLRTGGTAVPLLLLWLGLALNATSAGIGLRLLRIAAGGLLAGGLLYAAGLHLPAFILTSAGGAGVLLVAVDNIYNIRQAPGRRRYILAGVFSAVQGLALTRALTNPEFSAVSGIAAVLPALFVFGATVLLVTGIARRVRSVERFQPFLQVVSLLVALGGMIYLLDALQIRPWK